MKKKIILDVDTGIDDAVAIAMALYDSKLNVKLITCIAGNLSVNEVTKNTLNFIQSLLLVQKNHYLEKKTILYKHTARKD